MHEAIDEMTREVSRTDSLTYLVTEWEALVC